MPGPVHQHIRGLDVAVDESPCMGGVERACDLTDDVESTVELERAGLLEQPRQVDAVDEPRRQKELAVSLPHRIDRKDTRVVDRGREVGLAHEPVAESGIAGKPRRDQLQRHGAVECELGRAIHDAHAAAADHRLDAIPADDRARLDRHQGRSATRSSDHG